MQAYICTLCGFLYDDESAQLSPENKRIPFEEIDALEWICPGCGVKADLFKQTTSTRTPDVPVENKGEDNE